MLSKTLLVSLLGLSRLANAVTFSQNICVTRYGGTSTSPVLTSTTTSIKSYTATLRSTVTKTSTVSPSTITKTATVYTKTTTTKTLQKTDTFSTTTTEYDTETVYDVVTTTQYSTKTYTTTSYLSTTTVASSSAFTPLQSYISSLGYQPAKRHALAIDEAMLPRAAAAAAKASSTTVRAQMSYGSDGKPTFSPPIYPTQVKCTAKVQIISVTVTTSTTSSTATVTAPTPYVVVTSTSTFTITKTVNAADASTTVTATITSSIQSTTTWTVGQLIVSTSTVSAVGPVGTEYAACNDPGNFLQRINGAPLMGEENGYGNQYSTDPANAYDCCSLCESMGSDCGAFYYAGGYGCYTLHTPSGTCDATQAVADITVEQGEPFRNSSAGNSDCGRYTFNAYDYH